MSKKVLVVGSGGAGDYEILTRKIKAELGEDVQIVTPEEATEKGMDPREFDPQFTFPITPLPPLQELDGLTASGFKDGRQNRRERRKEERRAKKRK